MKTTRNKMIGGLALPMVITLGLWAGCTQRVSLPTNPPPPNNTPTDSATPINTPTHTATSTATFVATATFTPTATQTPPLAATPTATATIPNPFTPTSTFTPTPTPITAKTPTPTLTGTPDLATFTPTPTFTLTFIFTLTNTPTAWATENTLTPTYTTIPSSMTPTPTSSVGCASPVYMGDTADSGNSILVYPLRTYAQGYTLTQGGVLQAIWVKPVLLGGWFKVGIYSGSTSENTPVSLIYKSSAYSFTGLGSVPVTGVSLTPGNYWLAYETGETAGYLETTTGSNATCSIAEGFAFPADWMACVDEMGTATPMPICTPPTYSTANQILIYAQVCN